MTDQTTQWRRFTCMLLAIWSALSGIDQVMWIIHGASLWRIAVIVANVATAAILLDAFWHKRSLTWRFLIFPLWDVKQ